jgi:hypothetical protein
MIVEGMLAVGLLLQVATIVRNASDLQSHGTGMIILGIVSVVELLISLVFSALFFRRGKRAPVRLMVFLFLLLAACMAALVWYYPAKTVEEIREYRIHVFGNMFVVTACTSTLTAVVLKRDLNLPEKLGSVIKRVFYSAAAGVVLSPSVMRIDDKHTEYFWCLLATSLVLNAPMFVGFIQRAWRPFYLKTLLPVYVGCVVGTSIFGYKYYFDTLYSNSGELVFPIAVDLTMTALALIIGLIAEVLIFTAAIYSNTSNEESFSNGSENEKLVVPEEAEYSSTLPRNVPSKDV